MNILTVAILVAVIVAILYGMYFILKRIKDDDDD